MLKYKITCYDKDGNFKKQLADLTQNLINFGETINTGQGELVLRLDELFITDYYVVGDIIEIIVYSDLFKNGIERYSGAIHGLRRNYTSNGEWIELKIFGIFDFLNDINVTKTYSGALNTLIDEIITDAGISNNITSKPTKILGGTKLKNLITDTTNVSYDASDDDLFTVLQELFKLSSLNFYINQKGEIVGESSEKLLIASSQRGVEIEIDETMQTTITIKNNLIKNYSPNKPIKLLNIDSRYNLDGHIIQSINYNEIQTKLLLNKALIF